jgi:hypothetical protein
MKRHNIVSSRRAIGVCFAAFSFVLGMAASASAQNMPPQANNNAEDDQAAQKPLMLETYKSFFVGGQRVTKADGTVKLDGQA